MPLTRLETAREVT